MIGVFNLERNWRNRASRKGSQVNGNVVGSLLNGREVEEDGMGERRVLPWMKPDEERLRSGPGVIPQAP